MQSLILLASNMKKKIIAVLVVVILISLVYFLFVNKVRIVVIEGGVEITQAGYITLQVPRMLPSADVSIKDVPYINYKTATSKGKPTVTRSNPVELPGVVELTITFKLTTPTGTILEFEPLKLGAGGVHNFTLIVGPDESVSGNGTFTLEITFQLSVTPPAGLSTTVTITIIIEFNPATGEKTPPRIIRG